MNSRNNRGGVVAKYFKAFRLEEVIQEAIRVGVYQKQEKSIIFSSDNAKGTKCFYLIYYYPRDHHHNKCYDDIDMATTTISLSLIEQIPEFKNGSWKTQGIYDIAGLSQRYEQASQSSSQSFRFNKLFLDFDCRVDDTMSKAEFKAAHEKYVAKIQYLIYAIYKYFFSDDWLSFSDSSFSLSFSSQFFRVGKNFDLEKPTYTIQDSSRKGKLSFHVIFNDVLFANVYYMKDFLIDVFVGRTKAKCKEKLILYEHFIDVLYSLDWRIYNRNRQFRYCFSRKLARATNKIMDDGDDDVTDQLQYQHSEKDFYLRVLHGSSEKFKFDNNNSVVADNNNSVDNSNHTSNHSQQELEYNDFYRIQRYSASEMESSIIVGVEQPLNLSRQTSYAEMIETLINNNSHKHQLQQQSQFSASYRMIDDRQQYREFLQKHERIRLSQKHLDCLQKIVQHISVEKFSHYPQVFSIVNSVTVFMQLLEDDSMKEQFIALFEKYFWERLVEFRTQSHRTNQWHEQFDFASFIGKIQSYGYVPADPITNVTRLLGYLKKFVSVEYFLLSSRTLLLDQRQNNNGTGNNTNANNNNNNLRVRNIDILEKQFCRQEFPHIILNKQQSKFIQVSNSTLRECDALIIQAECGTGKSTVIKEFFLYQQYQQQNSTDSNCLISVVPRETLKVKHLAEFKRSCREDQLEVVCFESTFKAVERAKEWLRDGKQFTLLLDEIVSLFSHMRGQLRPELKSRNLDSIEWLIESCSKLIILDANLNADVLRQVMPVFDPLAEKQIHFVINTYEKSYKSLKIHCDQLKLVEHLRQLRDVDRKNVAVCSNSETKLQQVKLLLGDIDDGDFNAAIILHGQMDCVKKHSLSTDLNRKVTQQRKDITGTDDSEHEQIHGQFFYYTHTALVGMDVQLDFDYVCFIDSNFYIDTQSKYQLINRVRNVREGLIYCQISDQQSYSVGLSFDKMIGENAQAAKWDLLNFIKYDSIEFLSEQPLYIHRNNTLAGIIAKDKQKVELLRKLAQTLREKRFRSVTDQKYQHYHDEQSQSIRNRAGVFQLTYNQMVYIEKQPIDLKMGLAFFTALYKPKFKLVLPKATDSIVVRTKFQQQARLIDESLEVFVGGFEKHRAFFTQLLEYWFTLNSNNDTRFQQHQSMPLIFLVASNNILSPIEQSKKIVIRFTRNQQFIDIWNRIYGDIKKFEKKLNLEFINTFFKDLLIVEQGKRKRQKRKQQQQQKQHQEQQDSDVAVAEQTRELILSLCQYPGQEEDINTQLQQCKTTQLEFLENMNQHAVLPSSSSAQKANNKMKKKQQKTLEKNTKKQQQCQ